MTRATSDYSSLHHLTPAQVVAVTALATGATHRQAADAAGVHRITVTRWTSHHPEFIAELNRLRADAIAETSTQIAELTRRALEVVTEAVDGGDSDAAFRWLKLVPFAGVTEPLPGPMESTAVVEMVRQAMPSELLEMLKRPDERSTQEAEKLIADRLGPGTDI
ncbi:MAG: helix-turn-helix domain-containing protein [Acidimicrobiales bacterium]